MARQVSSRTLARRIAESASSLKAVDIRILNLSKLSSFTDYFVICSGTSNRHIQSVADKILEDQKERHIRVLGVEGYGGGEWVLLDYGGVVAHIFHPDVRRFYNIEKFWGDAKRVHLKGITD